MSVYTRGALLAGLGLAGAGAVRLARKRRMITLRGQTVLITGGSRGLGLALARAFAAEGSRIGICARDEEELERARADLESRGAEVAAFPCDIGDEDQVRGWIAAASSRLGPPDILVNNAGVIQVGPIESMQISDFDKALRIMFWGMVYNTIAVLPGMLERRRGRVVNITSVGGKVSVPHLVPYCCAKFAAVAFSEGLAAELAPKRIRVVTIAPGLMRTGSYLQALFKGDQQAESAWFGVSASLPLMTMSAERAARQIIAATRRGDTVRILTTQANLLARLHGAFPGLVVEALGAVTRLLPQGQDGSSKRGAETEHLHGPLFSTLTTLGRRAAGRLNELEQPAPAGS